MDPPDPEYCFERNQFSSVSLHQLVYAELSSSLTLKCGFCNESTKWSQMMWYFKKRTASLLSNEPMNEVELDMSDNQSNNRVFMGPDQSLSIYSVQTQDSGYYSCRSPWEASARINFIIDVTNYSLPYVISGTYEEWVQYSIQAFAKTNRLFSTSPDPEYKGLRDAEIFLQVESDWGPWGPCNGCTRKRKRTAKCTLHVVNLRLLTQSKVPLSPKYNIFNVNTVSCHSIELQKAFPSIANSLRNISHFETSEECHAPCLVKINLHGSPRYKNTVILIEGGHATFVCPEGGPGKKIEWKKNGQLVINRPGSNIMVDSLSTLYITTATTQEAGNYSCYVKDHKMQEVIVVVLTKSVVSSKVFLRHMQYLGFIFLVSFKFYTAGLLIAWTRRHQFEKLEKGPISINQII